MCTEQLLKRLECAERNDEYDVRSERDKVEERLTLKADRTSYDECRKITDSWGEFGEDSVAALVVVDSKLEFGRDLNHGQLRRTYKRIYGV